jgi:hypothetical protein
MWTPCPKTINKKDMLLNHCIMLNILFVCAFLWQYYNNVKKKYVKYPDGDLNPKVTLEKGEKRKKDRRDYESINNIYIFIFLKLVF